MKHLALLCLVGCAAANPPIAASSGSPFPADLGARFIRTDATFERAPRAEAAKILVSDKEINAEPRFKVVGVIELEGKETEPLATFVDFAQNAGAEVGCSVLVQRDAFELGTRRARMIVPPGPSGQLTRGSLGREWYRSDRVVWQFLCGVPGATDDQQDVSFKRAVATAVDLRRKELGNYEPCDPYTPTGSHIHRSSVCSNDPKHHSEADARTTVPFSP